MLIRIRDYSAEEICAGAQAGRELLARLLPLIGNEPPQPGPLFLDFTGVQVATASYLRESVFGLRDLLRARKSNLYPVLVNLTQHIRDELKLILPLWGEALLSCELQTDGVIKEVELLGRLDEKQQRIFTWIEERGQTDASELQQEFGASEGIQQTAWNNRLAALATAGLIVETSRGRSKSYRSLLRGD